MLVENLKKKLIFKSLPSDVQKKLLFHSYLRYRLQNYQDTKKYFQNFEDRIQLALKLQSLGIESDPTPKVTEENEEKILFMLIGEGLL